MLTSVGILKGCNQFSADATNAYAHAPPPRCKTYLRPDAAIREFYERICKRKLKDDEALPIARMLQGHPEASAAWDAFIMEILERIGFKHTTHEPSISRAIIDNNEILLARQVDDFRFATEKKETADKVLDLLRKEGAHAECAD